MQRVGQGSDRLIVHSSVTVELMKCSQEGMDSHVRWSSADNSSVCGSLLNLGCK